MSDQIEYIEPTQEHVGQMVEVRDVEHVGWTEATLTGLLQDDFRFAAKCSGDKYSIGWRFARIPRPLTYAERQAKCGLKVGDRVQIIRTFNSHELGFPNYYANSMDCHIGTVQTIDRFTDWGIRFERIGFAWPYFVLEKVEDRQATTKDFRKAVYVDGNTQDEFEIELIYQAPKEPWRAVVVKNDKRLVYELSNLRVKE